MSFAENTSKNIGKNISKSWSNKYRQKLLYHTKQPATNALKTASKISIEKLAEAISDFSHNKITKVSRSLPQNSSETVEITTEDTGFGRVIQKERYISPEKKRQQIIKDLRLIVDF